MHEAPLPNPRPRSEVLGPFGDPWMGRAVGPCIWQVSGWGGPVGTPTERHPLEEPTSRRAKGLSPARE